jgi:hypothetical protein
MDEANRLGRQVYFDEVIIKHEHPANNRNIQVDMLYITNESLKETDKAVYNQRKFKKYDLSVLICTIPLRKHMFVDILNRLTLLKQTTTLSIEVLFDATINFTIGEKRNKLLGKALGTYCCFIDDDDKVTDEYFKVIEQSGLTYDCISLNGMRYSDGKLDKPFYHSLKYTSWFSDENGYYRNPNHLNPMKTSIARQVGFPSKDRGEDSDFSKRLFSSGLIKTEYAHDTLQYIYMYVFNKVIIRPFKFGFRR